MKLQFVLPLTDFKTYITLSTFRVISIFVFLYSSCVSSVIYILELKDVFLLIGMQFSRYNIFNALMVETKGIEPLTPCVQGRCSPS